MPVILPFKASEKGRWYIYTPCFSELNTSDGQEGVFYEKNVPGDGERTKR